MDSVSHLKSFKPFLAAALIFHALLMVVQLKDRFKEVSLTSTSDVIKVKLLQELAQEATPHKKRQIVQSEDSATREKPKDEAFLSDKDRSFERQTVSRNVDSFKQAAKGNAAQTVKAQPQQASQQKKGLKDLKLSDIGMPAGEAAPKQASRAPASESFKGLENGDPNSFGFSATNDYVEEVALGDFTHLNTIEYKYYGFYHRIRMKLEQFWGNSIQEKAHTLFRSGRRLPASEDLITSLQITLNDKGEIIGVKILGTSGVKELDDAAIESFNLAGPFPNPPKGLLVNGKAVIEWGFVVKS